MKSVFYVGCMNSVEAIFVSLSLIQKSSIQYLIANLMSDKACIL